MELQFNRLKQVYGRAEEIFAGKKLITINDLTHKGMRYSGWLVKKDNKDYYLVLDVKNPPDWDTRALLTVNKTDCPELFDNYRREFGNNFKSVTLGYECLK